MKTSVLFTRAGLLGLALSLIAPVALHAEGDSDKPAEKAVVPPPAFKKYDKDGDGKLNDEEKAALKADREAQHKALIEKYDTDKDGKLSAEEKAAAKADREKQKAERKNKMEKKAE